MVGWKVSDVKKFSLVRDEIIEASDREGKAMQLNVSEVFKN